MFFCRVRCAGEVVGRERIRFAEDSYWEKASRRRFRVRWASESCAAVGLLCGFLVGGKWGIVEARGVMGHTVGL